MDVAFVSAVGVRRLEELVAWQLAYAFKLEVYGLLRSADSARADFRYCDQLRTSAASVPTNIAEGFHRYGAKEFARYLSIALASLGEAEQWVQDGIDRGYFGPDACRESGVLAKRCRVATIRLKHALDRLAKEDSRARTSRTLRTSRT